MNYNILKIEYLKCNVKCGTFIFNRDLYLGLSWKQDILILHNHE